LSSTLALRLAEARSLDKKKFAAKYPHPWLLSELVKLPSLAPPGSSELRPYTTDSMSQGARRMLATKPSPLALQNRTESFVLLPVIKSDRNMWEERILIGRAANNDIVLDDPSVSKAHAYFVAQQKQRYKLVALPSMNPTKINGELLPPHGDGAEVPEGATLELGLVACKYLDSVVLYTLLTARS
jgi:hypothetical protein